MRNHFLSNPVRTPQVIESWFNDRPLFLDLLANGFLNQSGVARYLHSNWPLFHSKKPSLESINMAIARFAQQKNAAILLPKNPLSCFAGCEILLHSPMASVTFQRNPQNLRALFQLYQKNSQNGEVFYIYQSIGEIAVILNERNIPQLQQLVSKSEQVNLVKNLCMLTIKTPPQIVNTPGVFHQLLGLLAFNQINVIDLASTYTELVVMVRDTDASKSYELLTKTFSKANSK